MAIFLTERLLEDFSEVDGRTLAVFFCDSSFNERRTATSIVRGLLYQLIQQHPHLLSYLLPEYKKRRESLFRSFDALWAILMEMVADQNSGQKYCIIDALDECNREDQEILLQQLQETFQCQRSQLNIRILITSRPYPEICEYLEEFGNKDLASFPHIKQDIDRFIDQKIESLAKRKRYTNKIKTEIGNILRDKAEETFLWVGLASKELEGVPSKDAIQALQSMPKGLHALYKRLLDALKEGQENSISQVQRILSFVAVCFRPLSVLELSEACQLHQDEEDKETRVQFTRDQILSCRLMVVIQDERVLLLHQSVKDFLVRAEAGHLIDGLEAHAQLSYRCVDVIMEKFHDEDGAYSVFSDYAIMEWGNHTRMAQSKFELKRPQVEFFEIDSPCREYWLQLYRRLTRSRRIPEGFSILHVAAHWGIVALAEKKYFKAEKLVNLVDAVDNFGMTPLDCAIQEGHVDIISILLNLGGKVTTQALWHAAMSRRNGGGVMALLLSQLRDQLAITNEVLRTAAGNWTCGLELMTLLLDQQGGQITITNQVMEAAARNVTYAKEVVTLLLDRQGDRIAITDALLEIAASNRANGLETMKLLLDRRGRQITLTENILSAAAENGESGLEIMQFLLSRCEGQITLTQNILSAASGNGADGLKIVQLLFDRCEGQVTITEETLSAAAGNEESGLEIMQLLLNQHGDQINIAEGVVQAALKNTCFGEEMIQLFLHLVPSSAAIIDAVMREAAGLESEWLSA